MVVEEGAPAWRVVAGVAGINNLRDLGGYRARNGVLGRNRLLRSGHLANATAEDRAVLRERGLGLVIDLRHPSEHARYPSRWPEGDVPRVVQDEAAETGDSLQRSLSLAMGSVGDAHAAMTGFYREAPFSPRYTAMFRRGFRALAETLRPGGGCALIHCAAGKDRTGLLVALLHHALGVGHDDIVADYLLTNVVGRPDERLAGIMRNNAELAEGAVDPAALLTMLRVVPGYLEAAFAAIGERHGSVDRYVAEQLGIDGATIAAIERAVVV